MVRHILADGREVSSIEGFVIPKTGRTEVVYKIVANIMRDRHEKAIAEKEAKKK